MTIHTAGSVRTLEMHLAGVATGGRTAMARALNHTLAKAYTVVTRQIAAQAGLAYGAVRAGVRRTSATPASLQGDVTGRGRHLGLAAFGARKTGSGVSAAPWAARRVFAGTFVIGARGGDVYRRTGTGRFPIRKLYGPAIPREMLRGEVPLAFEARIRSDLPARVAHELRRLLGG